MNDILYYVIPYLLQPSGRGAGSRCEGRTLGGFQYPRKTLGAQDLYLLGVFDWTTEDAFDMCQEVFLFRSRHLDQLKDPERFAQSLFRIARNTAHSHARGDHEGERETSLEGLERFEGPSSIKWGDAGNWERGEMKILVEKASWRDCLSSSGRR